MVTDMTDTLITVLTIVLGFALNEASHVIRSRRARAEALENRRLDEAERRDRERHDWAATEHRNALKAIMSSLYKLRCEAFGIAGHVGPMGRLPAEAAVGIVDLLKEAQDTHRSAKWILGDAFDDVCDKAVVCLSHAVAEVGMQSQGSSVRMIKKIKEFDNDLWPKLVVAMRQEVTDGISLNLDDARPMVPKHSR